jgi:integrase
MRIVLKHVQQRGGSWRYRRRVPGPLKGLLGRGEIIFTLGSSQAEAVRRYAAVHAEAERLLAEAARRARRESVPAGRQSPLELHAQARRRLVEEHGLRGDNRAEGPDDPELMIRDALTEEIERRYPADPESGRPVGVSAEDAAFLRVLNAGDAPPATLEDAKRLYLSDLIRRSSPSPRDQRKHEQRVERVVRHVKAALERDPVLSELRRADARKVLDHMLASVSARSTVDRYMNDLRALINHAKRELDELANFANPFMGLVVVSEAGAEVARSRRKPFAADQLKRTRWQVLERARSDDLKLIWRLLEGTGCRLAEITGLRVQDVVTDAPLPYLEVEWHEERRVKTEVSRRRVPLVGDALGAAKEAVAAAGDGRMLFAAYGRPGGNDAASQALMKHVRTQVDDPKVVVHSLRHNMKDRLVKAGVSRNVQDMILGHSSGGIGEDYGSDESRLVAATRAMRKALN